MAVAELHLATGGGDVVRGSDGAGRIEHRMLIAQHFDAVDAVDDHLMAAHLHFRPHPFLCGKGGRARFGDVLREKLTRHLHMRARRAQIARGSRSLALIGEELHLQARWEALIEAHALRRLRVQHHAAVEVHILRRICHHRPDEAILHAQDVVRVGQVGEKVAILLVKLLVAIVAHLQDAVFDPERVRKVLPQRPLRDLDRPPGQILAIEERNPFSFVSGGQGSRESNPGEEGSAGRSEHDFTLSRCLRNPTGRWPRVRRLAAYHEMPFLHARCRVL